MLLEREDLSKFCLLVVVGLELLEVQSSVSRLLLRMKELGEQLVDNPRGGGVCGGLCLWR